MVISISLLFEMLHTEGLATRTFNESFYRWRLVNHKRKQANSESIPELFWECCGGTTLQGMPHTVRPTSSRT